MRKAALLLVSIAMLGACEKDKPPAPQPTTTASAPPEAGPAPLPGFLFSDAGLFDVYDEDFLGLASIFGDILPAPADFSLDLAIAPCTTGCDGDIHIDATGKVTIKKAGKTREITLDKNTLSSISGKVRKTDFFTLKDEIGTGQPSATLTVTMNGQTKKVKHNYGDLVQRAPAKPLDAGLDLPPDRQRFFDLQSHIHTVVEISDPSAELPLPPALLKALAGPDAAAPKK